MKNYIITIIIFLNAIASFSQEKKLKNGYYTANNKNERVNLIIEDGKFHISVFSGVFEIKKDSIFLNDKTSNKNSGLTLKNLSKNNKIKSDKIQVTFNDYLYYINNFYVGTQNGEDEPKYKSLTSIYDELVVNGFDITKNNDFVFEIDKSEFIVLAVEDLYTEKTSISKFKLPENINDVTIEYLKDNFERANISGIINEKNNEITLLNAGKDPLVFKLYSEINANTNLLPLQFSTTKNWTYPGKTPKVIEETEETSVTTIDTAAVKIEERKIFDFKYFISKNFQEALKHNSKSPEKFLVVSVDLKNKKRQLQFDDFIKESEIVISEYYSEDEFKNQFDFYLATENDKKLLSKYKIKSNSEILVFNAFGDLIYHTPKSLTFNKALFGRYESAYSELGKAHLELEFDKVILNKKASTKEVLRMLSIASSLEIKATPLINKERVLDAEKTDPDYTTTGQPVQDENQVKPDEEIPPTTAIAATEPAQAYTDYDYYSIIKNKENLYRLKSTLKDANEKWEKIVVAFEKSNIIDEDYITVVKQQLNDKGFSKKIFDQSSFKIEDYRMLNYVFANYKTLNQEPEVKDNPATAFEPKNAAEKAVNEAARVATDAAAFAIKPYENQYNEKIIYVLEEYFSRFTNEIDLNDKDIKNQKSIKFLLFEYYKKFVQLTDYKTTLVNNYLNVLDDNLKDPEYKKEYYEIFEIYFNKIMAPNKSIIENLDLDYSLNDNDYWTSYKNNFANNCNLIAWEIVKNPNDKTLVQKAIKWSETSVEIEKNTHYYYDTLARLYYLSNQREKAIATQQKAIDLGGDSENSVEYKDVLQQMKNGTYTLPISKE